jgi:dihydroxyacetone kinase-like protein
MNTAFILQACEAVNTAILDHESVLESLDREIGDGDHFINMKRGCTTILGMREELSQLAPDAVLQKIGMKLLSTIGGASGPLIASFFMTMAKTAKEHGADSLSEIADAFSAGIDAIKSRGKSDLGEKTMLDVLIPVARQFKALTSAQTDQIAIYKALKHEAEQGVESTRNLIATKGRAAFLGERAIGHIDPGAKSCQIIIATICDLAIAQ